MVGLKQLIKNGSTLNFYKKSTISISTKSPHFVHVHNRIVVLSVKYTHDLLFLQNSVWTRCYTIRPFFRIC